LFKLYFMGKNFEGRGGEKLVKPIETERQIIELAYPKALEVIKSDEINPEDFKNCKGYKDGAIKMDLDFVARQEDRFSKRELPEQEKARKLAIIFEAIIHEQAELSDWLGQDVITKKASRYDDYNNGIDTIAEFAHPKGNLVLAIDVTTANPTKKLEGIKNDIDKGTLSHIKYFESSDEKFKGHFRGIAPKVIVGAEHRAVLRLASMWLKNEKKELGAHYMQLQILDEIVAQLDVFMRYADKIGQKNLGNIYEKQRDLIVAIRESKNLLYQQPGARNYAFSDGLYKTMLDHLGLVFKERATE